jgi:hypothetical protein
LDGSAVDPDPDPDPGGQKYPQNNKKINYYLLHTFILVLQPPRMIISIFKNLNFFFIELCRDFSAPVLEFLNNLWGLGTE